MTIPYAIDEETQPVEPINLGPSPIPVSDNVYADKAARAHFALAEKSPGIQTLKDTFKSGQEGEVRAQAAAQADIDFRKQKLAKIDALSKQGAPLSADDVTTLMKTNDVPNAEPSTVFEDKFGSNWMTAGVTGDPSKNLVFQSAFENNPERTRDLVGTGAVMISRKQQAKGLLEEAQAAHDALPWVNGASDGTQQDKLGNLAKNVFSLGFAQYVNQRNLVNSEPGQSWLPGSNKLEQIQYLYRLPSKEFLPALKSAAGPGSKFWQTNPSDALNFIRSAVQYSTSDALVDNTLGIANLGGVLPIKTTMNLLRGLRGAGAVDNSVTTVERLAQNVLKGSPTPPKTAGDGAMQTAADVLAGSSKAPERGYYLPQAAVQRDWEGKPRTGSFSADAKGTPRYTTDDGAEVQLARTPEEGHVKLNIEPQKEKTTFRTSRGSVYELHSDGTTTRDRASGPGSPGGKDYAGGEQPQSQKTIYVSKKDQDQLGVISNVDGEKTSLLQDDKGRWYSAIVSGPRAGKKLSNFVTASETPARGMYPVEIWDEGNRTHFGNKIVSVEKNVDQKVTFGPTIISKEEEQARVAIGDTIKSAAADHPQDALSKMGQHDEAATVAAKEILERRQNQTIPSSNTAIDAIRRVVPSFAQPSNYFNTATSLSARRATELANEAETASLDLINKTLGTTMVERLSPAAFDRAVEIAKGVIQSKYTRLSADAIRDQVTVWDAGSNMYRVETRITKPGGELFDSAAQATHYKNLQYRLKSSADVQQEGNKFYLSHVQHVDETQSRVRDVLTTGNETPRGGILNALMSSISGNVGPSIRSATHTSSTFIQDQKVTATHSPSVLRQTIDEEGKKIQAMGGKWTTNERHELETMTIHNRDYIPPDQGAEKRGFFYRSAGDFEQAFFARFNKMPSEKQIVAYDSYTRISDLDWVLREFQSMKDKGRQGVRNYKFNFETEAGKVKTDWINGKEVPDFAPLTTADANVYVLRESKFTTKYDLKDKTDFSKAVTDRIKSGESKIIQMYSPREKPLGEATGVKADIHFVVADTFDDTAVVFGENVKYRPGGHVIYEHQNYLKQPNIGIGEHGKLTHFGDTTFKSFATRNETEAWADKYEAARQFLINKDEAGFQKYMAAGNLPETASEYKQMVAQGTINLDPRAKFVHTLAGRDTIQSSEKLLTDPDLKGLKDTFTAYNMAQNSESAFLAERGAQLNTIKKAGTESNPIYQNVSAPLLDPYTSLQKGISQIVRSRWMSDMKQVAAESWVQEFGHMFDQSKLPMEKLRQNPLYYLYHNDAIDSGLIKANPEMYVAMKTSRDNILRFIGAQDEVGSLMKGLELKVVGQLDSLAGQSVANAAETTLLPGIRNIPGYMRAATFHLTEGFFNIVQLFQQGTAAGHAIAISPVNGMKGLTGSALVRAFRHTEDPAILNKMLDIAENMGLHRETFEDAFKSWKASGVSNIGGEVSMLNQLDEPKLFQSLWGKIADKGLGFFRAGDRLGRDVSWFTAHYDWRDANPGRALDNRARTEIADRYDTLNNNMTRASNAMYNEGLLSVPSQFYTWNARMAENMLGTKLTIAEKSKLAAYYSVMFGLPSTFSGATFGIPSFVSSAVDKVFGTNTKDSTPFFSYEDMRQFALTHNIPATDKFFSAMSKGLPNMIVNSVFGHDVDLQRFGPNSNQLNDFIKGQKEWTDVMLGASGQMAGKLFNAVAPFTMWAKSAFSQDQGYKIKANDFANVAENIASFSYAERAWVAYNYGKYFGKHEDLLADKVDTFESVLLGIGITPQRVTDAYQLRDAMKSRETMQKKVEKGMLEDWKLGVAAAQRGDHQTLTDYMTRIHTQAAGAGFTRQQEQDIFKKAVKNHETMIDQVNRKWLENSKEMQQIPAIKQWFENQSK